MEAREAGVSRVDEVRFLGPGKADAVNRATRRTVLVAGTANVAIALAKVVADDLDRRLRERLPTVHHVFLDPTQRS